MLIITEANFILRLSYITSNKYIRRKCLFKILNRIYTTNFQRHCQRQMARGEITLFVGNSARAQLILTPWMVRCLIPIATPQAVQERQPGLERVESRSGSSQLYLGYVHPYWQNAARKIWFYLIFPCWGRGGQGKAKVKRKRCELLMPTGTQQFQVTVSRGEADTYTDSPTVNFTWIRFLWRANLVSPLLFFSQTPPDLTVLVNSK